MDIAKAWADAQNYIKESEFEKALALLDLAIEKAPNSANLISERAVVYFHLGRSEEALRELDYCVLLEPHNPYRYSSRAYIKASVKDVDGAILDYEKCVSIDPDDAIAYNNLGLLLESKGRMKMARKNFDRADELEGLLKERGIDLSSEEKSTSINNTEKLDKESTNRTTWSIIKATFTEKSIFKEYLTFIKNGFRLKSKDGK